MEEQPLEKKSDKRFKENKKERNRVDKYKSLRKKKKGKDFMATRFPNQNQEQPASSSASHNNDHGDNTHLQQLNDIGSTIDETTTRIEMKQGHKAPFLPIKMVVTRKRKLHSSFLSHDDVTPVTGNKIMSSSVIQDYFSAVNCSSCNAKGSLELRQDNRKRKGMCETFHLVCTSCNSTLKTVSSSPTLTHVKRK